MTPSHKFQHGPLTIGLPDGWTDRSSLLFVGPTQKSTSGAETFRPNLSMAVVALATASTTPEAYLAEVVAKMRAQGANLEILGNGELKGRLAGAYVTLRQSLPAGKVRQWMAAFPVEGKILAATASTDEASADGHEPALRALLEQLEYRT